MLVTRVPKSILNSAQIGSSSPVMWVGGKAGQAVYIYIERERERERETESQRAECNSLCSGTKDTPISPTKVEEEV